MSSQVGTPTTDGFEVASFSDHNVNLAAQFAVEAQERHEGSPYELVSVIEAEQRVSDDGIDYRLTVNVLDSGQTRRAEAEVNQDPLGEYSLNSWLWDTARR
jgi:hypothetical protein